MEKPPTEITQLLSIRLLRCVVTLYDYLTLPIYYLCMQPWKVRHLVHRERAKRIDERTWVNTDINTNESLKKALFSEDKLTTLDELFRECVKSFSYKNALGYRKILAVEYDQHQGTTTGPKKVSKYIFDDKYTWHTYAQVETMVIELTSGLLNECKESLINVSSSNMVMIAADTCMQWFLFAHSCFRVNTTVATAYTTLDDGAILHSINETEIRLLAVSQKFAQRLYKLLPKAEHVDTVVLLDDPLPGEADEFHTLKRFNFASNNDQEPRYIKVIRYDELRSSGRKNPQTNHSRPKGQDIAILMYTSGSTGLAKGVMLSHENIVYTSLTFSGPGDITSRDRYIGYLPLGHVLELAAECIFMRNGSTIGYSSPFTLTDQSPLIKRGQPGDATLFKPTIMGCVPLVLERMKRAIQVAVKDRGPFFEQLIQFVQDYKTYWHSLCYSTPLMDRLICRKFSLILGGHMRAACSGGAALSADTQKYLRQVMNLNVIQGYGLTETSAAASFCDIWEQRYGVVGAPYPFVHIRLEDWSDYTIHDKPNPRGELVIGGGPVSQGYYKQPKLTEEAFYVDNNTGMRYFRTGDIGQILPDGILQIIDRKKDIVKPLSGEYISLVEVESKLKNCPLVENICVYCSQFSNYLVALVVPNLVELRNIAKQLLRDGIIKLESFGVSGDGANSFSNREDQSTESKHGSEDERLKERQDFIDALVYRLSLKDLCSEVNIVNKALEMIREEGIKNKLKRNLIPSKIKLISNEWTADSGLITASFKLRRREIEKFYEDDIKRMYESLPK